MTLQRTSVVRFSPVGLSDSLDATDEFPGAMAVLRNLIPDPSTKNVWTCRPAETSITSFTEVNAPVQGVIVKVIGNFAYGMVSAGAGALASLTSLVQGSGYPNNGSYTNVPFSGGHGAGGTCNIVISAGGVVASCTLVSAGYGYQVGDSLTVSNTNLGGTGAGFSITVATVLGSYDWPFAYNLATNSFAAIANVINYPANKTNIPATQPTTGDWVPPTVELCGAKLVFTHPGFAGTNGNYFGWLDVSNPAAMRWHAGNLWATGALLTLGAIGGTNTGGTPGTYYNVALTGTPGSGATADIVVDGGGHVASVSLNSFGSAYTTGVVTGSATGLPSSWNVAIGTVQAAGLITFTVAPSAVAQFYGRAYFLVNPPTGQPSAVFTDSLSLACTNANQALTFGDNVPLTAAAPLGLSNQLGGIVQALLVFKGNANIEQITGDAALSTLAVNTLTAATGTLAPWSVVSTPEGVAFLAPDGVRVINQNAVVGTPIGLAGKGVVAPLIDPLYPSRVNAACNSQVLRISLQSTYIPGSPWVEYWYDVVRQVWSGPHTFPSSTIDSWGALFVSVPQAVPAQLFQSTINPDTNSVYVENGTALSWLFQTAVLEDNQEMAMSEIAELQIKTTAIGSSTSLQISAIDQNGSVWPNGSFNYTTTVLGGVWGTMVWGVSAWGTPVQALYPRWVQFPGPVIYNRLAIAMSGNSTASFRIGDTYIRRRVLGYLQETA